MLVMIPITCSDADGDDDGGHDKRDHDQEMPITMMVLLMPSAETKRLTIHKELPFVLTAMATATTNNDATTTAAKTTTTRTTKAKAEMSTCKSEVGRETRRIYILNEKHSLAPACLKARLRNHNGRQWDILDILIKPQAVL